MICNKDLFLISSLVNCYYILFCRFTVDPNGLMVASDVAARGLDIPKVEHVIHYQTPKNSEVHEYQFK